MPLAAASRFAVLNIEDDDSSDEDSVQKVVGGGQKQKGTKDAKGKQQQQQQFQSQKKKNRGRKKHPQARLSESGILVREGEDGGDHGHRPSSHPSDGAGDIESFVNAEVALGDPDEISEEQLMQAALRQSQLEYEREQTAKQREQQEMDRAVQESKLKSAPMHSRQSPPSQPPTSLNGTTPIASGGSSLVLDGVIQKVDHEAKVLISARASKLQPSETKLVNLYRGELKNVIVHARQLNVELDDTKAECTKYKERYKKLCELLKDAEVKEKARLLLEIERGNEQRNELSEQVQEMHSTIEQLRSKLHDYEQGHNVRRTSPN